MFGVRLQVGIDEKVKKERKIACIHQRRVKYIIIADLTRYIGRVFFSRVCYPIHVATENHLSDLQDRDHF
jgi:hypothetical protein